MPKFKSDKNKWTVDVEGANADILTASPHYTLVEDETAAEVEATAAAKKLAEVEGVDLAGVEGTGDSGKMLKGDVAKATK